MPMAPGLLQVQRQAVCAAATLLLISRGKYGDGNLSFTMISMRHCSAWKRGNAMQSNDYSSDSTVLHFVESDTQIRAELFKLGISLGYHCEIYDDFSELAAHPPRSGIIILRDRPGDGGMGMAIERLLDLGIWLPVIAMDADVTPSRVVRAIKEGALDYLTLPLKADRLEACLARIREEAAQASAVRRRLVQSRNRLATLSCREREVLEALAAGGSNKEIARKLNISPRTVEIHRANMMGKLGARHAADAIRIRLESDLSLIA
jgi:FixJ family two-component response regulator